jgi:hypothetical protein
MMTCVPCCLRKIYHICPYSISSEQFIGMMENAAAQSLEVTLFIELFVARKKFGEILVIRPGC